MMELVWIEDFLALAEERNFTKAADRRATTQPAYSRRIRQLEEWLGGDLFNRDARPVMLTPAGREFHARALKIRDEILDARRAVRAGLSHFEKPVRICTTNTLATCFFPCWIKGQDLGAYSLSVASVSNCLEAFRRGRADMAIIPLFDADRMAEAYRVIGEDQISLIELKGTRHKITLNRHNLDGPLMLYTPGTAHAGQVNAMMQKHKLAFVQKPICESASAEALWAQVQMGFGAAWIPRMLAGDLAGYRIVSRKFDIPYHVALFSRD